MEINEKELCPVCRMNRIYMVHKVGLIICSNAVIISSLLVLFGILSKRTDPFFIIVNMFWIYWFGKHAHQHWDVLTIPHAEDLEENEEAYQS